MLKKSVLKTLLMYESVQFMSLKVTHLQLL